MNEPFRCYDHGFWSYIETLCPHCPCKWHYNAEHDYYSGTCGAAIQLNTGTPIQNDYLYCPKCGRKIEC